MLYSVYQIQSKIANIIELKSIKRDVILFCGVESLIKEDVLKDVFTVDQYAGLFISEEKINQLVGLINKKFNVNLNLDHFYDGKLPLKKVDESKEKVISHKVLNENDINQVLDFHMENSSFGKKQKKQEDIKKEQKSKKMAILQEKIEERRRIQREKFDLGSNLNRDFVNSKVLSLDFEFFLDKVNKMHEITELGITFNDNGKEFSYHYLIEENYRKKKNQNLQKRFNFGKTEIIPLENVSEILSHFVGKTDYIIFHEQREDVEILDNLWIQIPEDKVVVDTQLCFKRYFRPKGSAPNGETLDNLLKNFKLENKDLHNAGNDAYYTLKLLQKMSEIHKLMNRSSFKPK
jgi:hypothetical protein